jgi:acetylornithine/succinyldiaminopimelate/putrescine aminotransferase
MTYIDQIPKQESIKLFHDHVSSGKVDTFTSYGMDFIFGRRKGIYIWDVDGKKRLINCHSNGGVFNLGHRNPEIIKTLKSAMDELDVGNHHLISEQRALLARKLAQLMPGDINYTVFGVSGGEAIDTAIKIARAYTKRPEIISAVGGYHGHTGFALAAGDEKYRKPFGPMPPGFSQAVFNDIAALEKAMNDQTAAVLFETVPATLGMYVPDTAYFKQVRELCDKNGSLMIIDEVQTGLGRTGKLWGIEHFDVVPDIIVIGKGLSGGMYPMTATCFKEKLETVFKDDPFIHVSTFGGAEVGCPVALKVLEISSDQSFLRHVNTISLLFEQGFRRLKEKYPKLIVSFRQLGLMMGVKMANEMCGPVLTKACYDNGILSIYANNDTSVSQLMPPLIISEQETKEVLEKLDKTFEQANTVLDL